MEQWSRKAIWPTNIYTNTPHKKQKQNEQTHTHTNNWLQQNGHIYSNKQSSPTVMKQQTITATLQHKNKSGQQYIRIVYTSSWERKKQWY
jgi:hypothetical protein